MISLAGIIINNAIVLIDQIDIVDTDGVVVGRTTSVQLVTIGQRKGLGVATGDPLYVVRLDAATAQVVVGPREALAVDRITLKDINWLGDDALADGVPVRVKVRSTRPPVDAAFSVDGDEIGVVLPGGEEGVAPGQACVFYSAEDDGRVLGGGWIAKTSATAAAKSGGYRLIG